MDVPYRYGQRLTVADGKLVLVSASENLPEQLAPTRVTSVVGAQNIYASDEWVCRTIKKAYSDATEWIDERRA